MNGILTITTAATSEVVSVADLKRHCSVEADDTEHDVLLQGFRDAAVEQVAEHCGLVLAPTWYQYRLQHWCNPIRLPLSPVREIERVAYLNSAGIEHDLDASEWEQELFDDGAVVHFTDAFTRPALRLNRHAVRVYLSAGFDDPTESGSGIEPRLKLPARAVLAIKAIAAAWFENREAVLASEAFKNELARDLLAQLRVYR